MAKKLTPKEVTDRMIADLRDGLDSPFWRTLKKITEQNIVDVQADINAANESDLSNEKLRNLIDWRNFLEHFLTLPESVIESLQQGETEPTNYDPYKSVKERL